MVGDDFTFNSHIFMVFFPSKLSIVHLLCKKLTGRCILFRTQTYSNRNCFLPSCHCKYVEKYIVIIIFDLITKLLYFSLRTQVWILYSHAYYNHVSFQQYFFLRFRTHSAYNYTRISSYTAWIREHSNGFTFDWEKVVTWIIAIIFFSAIFWNDMFCKRISESTTIQVSNSFIVISGYCAKFLTHFRYNAASYFWCLELFWSNCAKLITTKQWYSIFPKQSNPAVWLLHSFPKFYWIFFICNILILKS